MVLSKLSALTGFVLLAGVDLSVFMGVLQCGVTWGTAHIISFLTAVIVTSFLAARRVGILPGARQPLHFSTGRIAAVASCVLFLRAGLLATLVDVLEFGPLTAILYGAAFSAGAILWGHVVFILSPAINSRSGDGEWPQSGLAVGSIVVFSLLLRLFYSGPLELLHEEGYYWLYAQFIDIGYLDHPPMVGWLIWIFTTVLGQSEFAVRIGALACWLITAWYAFQLSEAIAGKTAGLRALLLVAILPAFFAFGLFMTPDAPLVACWAGALYYLYRALIDERPGAWLGVGLFLGLGLLSKYTMGLLGGAAAVFVLVTPDCRKWVKRPEPYLAMVIALSFFSPVIKWNAANEWASFYFQGIGRHLGSFNFGLQDLVGSVLVLLTPVGLLSLVAIGISRQQILSTQLPQKERQTLRFLAFLTLLPLSVFFFFSLFKMSKLNWTAPIWLGALPYLALYTNPLPIKNWGRRDKERLFPRLWPLTTGITLVLYGAVLHYLVIGFPGIPYPQNVLGIGKQSMAHQIHAAKEAFKEKGGEEPLVVCWGAERYAGWMAYYLSLEGHASNREALPEAVLNTTGSHLFGEDSKMFRYWHPLDSQASRILLLIGDARWKLEYNRVLSKATPISDVYEIFSGKNGKPVGHHFYRFFIFRWT